MQYIYIAGPYSRGDQVLNVRAAVLAADRLMASGYTPFVPHLSMLWHQIAPKEYEEWVEYDNQWLRKCDAVLRLPGASQGADAESMLAQSLGIPVFHTITDLMLVDTPAAFRVAP